MSWSAMTAGAIMSAPKPIRPQQLASCMSSKSPVAANLGRLIGDARVIGAVGQARERLAAAEEEVGATGIADRPAAGLLGEFEQCAALTEWDDVVDQLGLGLHIKFVGVRKRGVAPHRRARYPQHVRLG